MVEGGTQPRFRRGQALGLSRSRGLRRADRSAGRGHDALSVGADRGRRRGRAALRSWAEVPARGRLRALGRRADRAHRRAAAAPASSARAVIGFPRGAGAAVSSLFRRDRRRRAWPRHPVPRRLAPAGCKRGGHPGQSRPAAAGRRRRGDGRGGRERCAAHWAAGPSSSTSATASCRDDAAVAACRARVVERVHAASPVEGRWRRHVKARRRPVQSRRAGPAGGGRPFLFNLFNDPAIIALPSRCAVRSARADRRPPRPKSRGRSTPIIGGASPLLAEHRGPGARARSGARPPAEDRAASSPCATGIRSATRRPRARSRHGARTRSCCCRSIRNSRPRRRHRRSPLAACGAAGRACRADARRLLLSAPSPASSPHRRG